MQKRPEELLALWVQGARHERGWTQQDLADRLTAAGTSMHSTAVTRLEQGKRAIRFDEVVALLEVFGETMGDLMGHFQAWEEMSRGLAYELDRSAERPRTIREVAETVEVLVGTAHDLIRRALEQAPTQEGDDGVDPEAH